MAGAGTEGDIPMVVRIGLGVGTGPRDGPAPLCKVALAILEATGDLGSLARLAFALWGRLETLYFLETTVGG